jgi:hypothetical protein
LKVLAVLKMTEERELRPGPAATELIPRLYIELKLLRPVFTAKELMPS